MFLLHLLEKTDHFASGQCRDLPAHCYFSWQINQKAKTVVDELQSQNKVIYCYRSGTNMDISAAFMVSYKMIILHHLLLWTINEFMVVATPGSAPSHMQKTKM